MNLTKDNIEEYITLFMEGETTNEEERAIYRFFRTEEVPAHLKEYIPMFAWYEEGMPQKPSAHATKAKRRFRLPVEVWSIGIAASLALLLGFGALFLWGNDQELPEEWACYEGSYIEVKGKRISNIEEILPCIIETLNQAETIERLAQERIDEIKRSEEFVRQKEMLVNN